MELVSNFLEPLRGSVVALYPTYDEEKGNTTQLFSRSAEVHLMEHAPKWTLREYLELWALSLSALRKLYSVDRMTKKKPRIAPLPIYPGHTLVPFRARKCIGRNDGAYAYLELESIDISSIQAEDEGISLCCGGHRFRLLTTSRHLYVMLGLATHAAEKAKRLNSYTCNCRE